MNEEQRDIGLANIINDVIEYKGYEKRHLDVEEYNDIAKLYNEFVDKVSDTLAPK